MATFFSNPVKIHEGRGSLEDIAHLLGDRPAILVTTHGMVRRGVVKQIEKLCCTKIQRIVTKVTPNTTFETIRNCYAEVCQCDFNVVIGLGGGSALDTAKAIAFLSGCVMDIDELIIYLRNGKKKGMGVKAKPLIAIPTTSGTGSEVTSWGSIWDQQTGKKYSLMDESLYPEWALLDANLTDSLPYSVTLSTALDALSHAMEAIWNKNANPVSDGLAFFAISLSVSTLGDRFQRKYKKREVRDKLQQASLLAGLAFSNTQTALAHSISYPLTAKFGIPHGFASSLTLAEVLRFNYPHDKKRIGAILHAMRADTVQEGVSQLYRIFWETGVPEYLKIFIKDSAGVFSIEPDLITSSRAKNNVVVVSQKEATKILRSALVQLLPKEGKHVSRSKL